MKKDIPVKKVEDVFVAIAPKLTDPEGELWEVFVINLKPDPIKNVLIASKGYGELDGEEVKTSVLRHFFDQVEGSSYQQVEQIQTKVFGLNNEYWLSFSFDNFLYDRKFTFVSDSIQKDHFTTVPILNRPGVMIA
ncbi:MAG: hypothetical protein AAF399_22780 [Bacteroidota bacterium]